MPHSLSKAASWLHDDAGYVTYAMFVGQEVWGHFICSGCYIFTLNAWQSQKIILVHWTQFLSLTDVRAKVNCAWTHWQIYAIFITRCPKTRLQACCPLSKYLVVPLGGQSFNLYCILILLLFTIQSRCNRGSGPSTLGPSLKFLTNKNSTIIIQVV